MSYIDGFVAAVPTENKEAYRKHAAEAWPMFQKLGAIDMIECWGDDVPDGVQTSFPMAVKKKDDETVVFAWVVWPSKAVRDLGYAEMMKDPAMGAMQMPFDAKRMIYGEFMPIVGDPVAAKPAQGVVPYLFFRGRCEEAITYYKEKLGAKVGMMMRFRDNPDKPPADKVSSALDDRIMHASLTINGSNIMMSDGMRSGPLDFQCMSLSLAVATEADADRLFHALAADGKVEMPIGKTFFSPRFGAVTDKFGVAWMIIVEPPAA